MAVGHSESDCTTGFKVRASDGLLSMVTAGHCFSAIGTNVVSPGSGQLQGHVDRRAIYPHDDVELISGKTYAAEIYVSQNSNTTNESRLINGASDPVTGRAIYCHSGAATFVQCNQTVNDLDASICDPGVGCTLHLIEYGGGAGASCGDSGAPFYLPGTKVGIRGDVIAGDRDCITGFGGTHNWATKWSKISSIFGVSIVTG